MKRFAENLGSFECNEAAEKCTNIYLCAANRCLKRVKRKKSKQNQNNQKWFDNKLICKRKFLRKLSRQINKGVPTKYNVEKLRFLSKEYKRLCKNKMQAFKNKTQKQFEELQFADPKKAWQKLNELKGDSNNNPAHEIEGVVWYNHYKNLNTRKDKYSLKEN